MHEGCHPTMFKSLILSRCLVHISDGDQWGELYIWSPKHLSRESADVSAFFGKQITEGVSSICSPTYLHSLRSLYITMFSLLFGNVSNFNSLENFFDSSNPRRSDVPSQVMKPP